MCGEVGAVSISTYIHFGLRRSLRTEPLRDLEISVFVCALLLLLLLLLLVKILSPLCRVFTHIFLRQTMSLGIQCCSYSVATVYGAHITNSFVGSNVLLHQHFPKYVCSAQYSSFL
jgi:hypothetical protein